MVKEVFKKLLIAAVTGAIILAFVYVKDNYLDEGDKDAELLNEVTFSQEVKPKKEEPKKIEEEPAELVIEVENTEDKETTQVKNSTTQEVEPIEKENIQEYKSANAKKETSFDDFKKAMTMNSSADAAFAELEKETNK